MKYSKKKLTALICGVVTIVAASIAGWQLMPMSADGMRQSTVIVEQTTWHEVCIDGKPQLYFSGAMGDSALLGVTANRDSASHRKRMVGCWVNTLPLIPSCRGRVATLLIDKPTNPRLKGDSAIVRLCRQSIDKQLQTLKAQKTELDYYLRVHGVQDNGYQTIASLADHINKVLADVQRAGHMLDSLTNGKHHKLTLKTEATYTAVYHNNEGKPERVALNVNRINRQNSTMLLQTTDRSTPSCATPLSRTLWACQPKGRILAVGYPGLGEDGLVCDTIRPIVVPGKTTADGRHDMPQILVSDGAPVFTSKGWLAGIVSGTKIVNRLNW